MRSPLSLDRLHDRLTPASLSLSGPTLVFAGDPTADAVTLSVSNGVYTLTDPGHIVAVAAGLPFRGTGTATVSGRLPAGVTGIRIDLGAGDDTANIQSAANPVAVATGGGTDAVNLGSAAPLNTGTLERITAPVDVAATGGSAATLQVSAGGQTFVPGAVAIDGSRISGMLGAAGNTRDVTYHADPGSAFAGLSVQLPSGQSFTKDVTVGTVAAPLRLDCGEGHTTLTLTGNTERVSAYFGLGGNTVNVTGDAAADIRSGGGADTFTVAAGATLDGSIKGGGGADVFDIEGTVTGYVGP